MRKKFAIVALLFALSNTLDAQKQGNRFQLKGKLVGLLEGMVYLYYSDVENKSLKDSSVITNGNFSFAGSIMGPTRAYLQLKEEKINNGAEVFLEPVSMKIRVKPNEFKKAELTGSKTQNEFKQLEKLKAPIRKQVQPVLDEYAKVNEIYINAVRRKAPEDSLDFLKEKATAIREKYTPYDMQFDKVDYEFFVKNPNSYVTAYMMRFHVSEWSLDTLQMFYDKMNETIRQSSYGKDLAKAIADLRGGLPGSLAKDFSAIDINGNKLTLSGFKGRYVLLDFWASWCVPCRKGNPHLKELYAKYKDKGIEFIGVSDDDRTPDAWKKAVEKDGLPWRHVLRGFDMDKRLKGLANESEIHDRFGIYSLPTKILIDPAGMIIGRFGEEEKELDEMLVKIFGA
ncbi:MAG: redoxin domain-containing protein [Chitinophagales bacterium]